VEAGEPGAQRTPPRPRREPTPPEPEPEPDPDGEDVFPEDQLLEDLPEGTLRNVVWVRLRDQVKVQRFDAGEFDVEPGQELVVETDQGLMVGTALRRSARTMMGGAAPPRLIRPMDHNDKRQEARNAHRQQEAFEFCRERIRIRKLPMKLIRVKVLHGGNKAIFFFASESRVDFRDLVKDLAQRFHTRIMMRQVGVRDEARMTGAIGSCGCELCCATWLPKFEPVSIRMAKDQGMVLNPQKVSGQCGRLKCCLGYELEQYLECRKDMPKLGRRVQTPDGEGRVLELSILQRQVRVAHADGTVKIFSAEQVRSVAAPDNDARRKGNAKSKGQ
jgi:cell fate regulator YaaT (PSP1 superfamily)